MLWTFDPHPLGAIRKRSAGSLAGAFCCAVALCLVGTDSSAEVAPASPQGSPAAPHKHDPGFLANVAALKDTKDTDHGIVEEAARALGKSSDPCAPDALISALRELLSPSRDEFGISWKVSSVVDAVKHIKDPRGMEIVRVALWHQNAVVRVNAVRALDSLAEADDVNAGALLRGALQDKSAKVREAAAGALGSRKTTGAVPELIAALRDEDEDVREEAAEALGEIGDPSAAEPLAVTAKKDKSMDVRKEALEALNKLSGNGR